MFRRYSSENLQATRLSLQSITRAVSSVVERDVYTEFYAVFAASRASPRDRLPDRSTLGNITLDAR